MVILNKDTERLTASHLLKCLKHGMNVTLVCDNGTPGISDPGYFLVGECHNARIKVEALPGSSSVTLALSASGFPSDRFEFQGFYPKKESLIHAKILQSFKSNTTSIGYVNKARLLKLLKIIISVYGEDQPIFIANEMTKKY